MTEKEKILQLFSEQGANAFYNAKEEETILMHAVYIGEEELVQTLIQNRADVNAKNAQGYPVLAYGLWTKNVRLIADLLDAGAIASPEHPLGRAIERVVTTNGFEVKQALDNGLEVYHNRKAHRVEMATASLPLETQMVFALLLEMQGVPEATRHCVAQNVLNRVHREWHQHTRD